MVSYKWDGMDWDGRISGRGEVYVDRANNLNTRGKDELLPLWHRRKGEEGKSNQESVINSPSSHQP